MNKDLDQYVRNRLTSENEDALIKEFADTIAKVKKEREIPKTPIKDNILDPKHILMATDTITADFNGNINKSSLARLVCIWMCQNGIVPDRFSKTPEDFIGYVCGKLDALKNEAQGKVCVITRVEDDETVAKWIDSMSGIFDTLFGPARPSAPKNQRTVYNQVR